MREWRVEPAPKYLFQTEQKENFNVKLGEKNYYYTLQVNQNVNSVVHLINYSFWRRVLLLHYAISLCTKRWTNRGSGIPGTTKNYNKWAVSFNKSFKMFFFSCSIFRKAYLTRISAEFPEKVRALVEGEMAAKNRGYSATPRRAKLLLCLIYMLET